MNEIMWHESAILIGYYIVVCTIWKYIVRVEQIFLHKNHMSIDRQL